MASTKGPMRLCSTHKAAAVQFAEEYLAAGVSLSTTITTPDECEACSATSATNTSDSGRAILSGLTMPPSTLLQ